MTTVTTENRPLIIAHRGNCDGLPENSETAFRRSVRYGVNGIETDVQLTKDNIPVIFHDRTGFKLAGSKKWISSYTLDELKQFNIKNERILTLDKTIKLLSGKVFLYIEIKSGNAERQSGRSELLTDKVMEQVLALPSRYRDNISILSFDPDVLRRAYSISDKIKYVLNIDEYNKPAKWSVRLNSILNKEYSINKLSGLCIKENRLTETLVTFAGKNDKTIFTYSCNTEKQLKRLLSLNIDGIMTDRAEWLTKEIP